MKKALAVVLCLLTALCFTSCKREEKPQFTQDNLALLAKADDTIKKLIDGKSSTVTLNAGDSFELDFGKDITFNTMVLKEKTDNVLDFNIYKLDNAGNWVLLYKQDRILDYRVCYVEPTTTSKIKFELAKCYDESKPIKLNEIEIYNYSKDSNQEFKVSQYLVMGENEIVDLKNNNDEGFSGYYNVVTDTIIIGSVRLNSKCEIEFTNGEEDFKNNLAALREIIGDRKVRIWSTVLFDQKNENGETDHDLIKDFVNNNIDKIESSIKGFVEKYDLYGIDLDWEYPTKAPQWKAYDKMVQTIAGFTKVSVALPPWGIKFSDETIKVIEHINVMTYDLFDERGDHSNPYIGGIDGINKVRKAGFDDSQILLGIPTYGRTTNKSGAAWPVYRDSKFLGKWGNFVPNYEYEENDATQTCDGYLNGYAMVRDKTALAEISGIGGVMLFRAKCDEPYTYEYSLHKAVEEVIENY